MAVKEFNLIDEPWIPCVGLKRESLEYGIRDVLKKSHELREIFDPSPLVTTALHRLLLAVLYRVLGGIDNRKAWMEMFKKGHFDADMINTYLEKWRDRFFLIHDQYPFYQMASLETRKEVTVARLVAELASGNNPTLFDHTNEGMNFSLTYPEAARYLVACQAFALGFGKSGKATINGKIESRPYFKDAIALRGMNLWLQGKTLFHTLSVNTSFIGDNSCPPWEMDDPHSKRDEIQSAGKVDILTWQSRLIRLIAEDGKIERMCFTQGRHTDKEDTEDPMKVYKKTKEGYNPLSLKEDKAVWRDYHTISMAIAPEQIVVRRPECFNLVSEAIEKGIIDESECFISHVTGLATSQGKAGKFVLWRHERLPLPAILLKPAFLEVVDLMIRYAETAAGCLKGRLTKILSAYLEPENKPVNREELNRVLESINPLPQYWARLEPGFYQLLHSLPQDWDYNAEGWKDSKDLKAGMEWRGQIKEQAQRALEDSVKMMGNTARAIRAIEKVGTSFSDRDLGLTELDEELRRLICC